MKICMLFAVVLLAAIVSETVASLHQELLTESDNEVVYRVARGIRDRKKGGECRYKKGPWEDCDVSTNTERRTLTLKRGDSTCEQTKVLTRKCKKACKYEKGEWNDCEVSSNTRTRTDNLKPKSDASCQPTRTISKKCKKGDLKKKKNVKELPVTKLHQRGISLEKVCRYSKQAAWTECDPGTGKKTKVLVLTNGDPNTCEANKKITKPCRGGRKVGKGKQMDDDDYDDDE